MIFDAAGGIAEVKAKLLAYLQMSGLLMEECGPLDFSSRFRSSTSRCRKRPGFVTKRKEL